MYEEESQNLLAAELLLEGLCAPARCRERGCGHRWYNSGLALAGISGVILPFLCHFSQRLMLLGRRQVWAQ